jgi:uncharacterized protein YbjT (DUF2867 family)
LAREKTMIVITAPTSGIGRQVVRNLLDDGTDGTAVRVVARDPARLAPDVAERVEIVRGSHSDPSVVAAAFIGADAVFWLVPADPRPAASSRPTSTSAGRPRRRSSRSGSGGWWASRRSAGGRRRPGGPAW